jgi:hypothetical protein
MLAIRGLTAEDVPAITAIVQGLPDYFTSDVPESSVMMPSATAAGSL